MNEIKKTTLHPEGDKTVDLYPKTSADQIEGIQDVTSVPFYFKARLRDGDAINTDLLVPDIPIFNGAKIIDDNGELYQAIAGEPYYRAKQLTSTTTKLLAQMQADKTYLQNVINTVNENLSNEIATQSQDLEAKIAEVDADSLQRNAATLEAAKAYTDQHSGAGVLYVTIEQSVTATSGTFTSSDMSILTASKENKIIFDNEIYSLQDNQHETGYLIYTHVGHNSANAFFTKCITVTVSTGGWVLTQLQQQQKLYSHIISIIPTSNITGEVFFNIISPIKEELGFSDIVNYITVIASEYQIWFVANGKLTSGSTSTYVYGLRSEVSTQIKFKAQPTDNITVTASTCSIYDKVLPL